MNVRIAKLTLGIACMVCAGGCSTYKDPSVIVTGARLAEITDEAVAIKFGLDIHNPNVEPLTLVEFKYDLSIDGQRVYEGVRAAESVLAIKGDKHVEIPGVIRFDKAGWQPGGLPASANYRLNGRLQYVTPGKIVQILFDSGVRKPSAPFAGSGEVNLAATPATLTATLR